MKYILNNAFLLSLLFFLHIAGHRSFSVFERGLLTKKKQSLKNKDKLFPIMKIMSLVIVVY